MPVRNVSHGRPMAKTIRLGSNSRAGPTGALPAMVLAFADGSRRVAAVRSASRTTCRWFESRVARRKARKSGPCVLGGSKSIGARLSPKSRSPAQWQAGLLWQRGRSGAYSSVGIGRKLSPRSRQRTARRGLALDCSTGGDRRVRSHADECVLGDSNDAVIRTLGERRSQTRLGDIAVPDGKPHSGAVEPQNEVLAYLHQSHRSGRRERDSAQARRALSRPHPLRVARGDRCPVRAVRTPSEGGLRSLDRVRSRRRRFPLRRSGHPRTRGKCASRSARLPPLFSRRGF